MYVCVCMCVSVGVCVCAHTHEYACACKYVHDLYTFLYTQSHTYVCTHLFAAVSCDYPQFSFSIPHLNSRVLSPTECRIGKNLL